MIGAEPIEEQDRERIRAAFPDARFTFAESSAEALAAAPEAEVVFSKSTDALAAAPLLKWFQAGTAGVDRALKVLEGRPEVVLTNARGAHGVPMAENILTMALCFATRMHRLIRTQPQKAKIGREVIAEKWELDGQTMLVLGLGDIGGTLAHKAKALGMRVIGVRRSGEPHPEC